MFTLKKALMLCLVSSVCLHQTSVYAHTALKEHTEKKDSVMQEGVKNDTKKDKVTQKEADKKPSEYETLIKKGGSYKQGMFGVRHIENKWYFDIPQQTVGRYFLFVTRFNAVPQQFNKFSGEEVSHHTLYFEHKDDKLLLRSFVETQIADPKDAIAVALKQSTIDPIIASFNIIKSDNKRDSLLIDVTNFISKDNNFTGLPNNLKNNQKLGGMIDERSFVDTVKTYPLNIEISSTRTYSASPSPMIASTTGSATMGLNTSIVMLPEKPMKRRIWDERVGYFVNRFTLFSDKEQSTEKEAFISRYRLVPKNVKEYAKGKLVEPIKPIVYYIDPATPKKWVPYLIAGINDWNKAFEAAGFKNAIVGKEWPNDSNMSLDDARYSVIRYLPAEIENAYGPRITDPRSGEIIESHICWYHNVMRILKEWYLIQCAPNDKSAQTMQFSDELMGQLIRFVSSHEVGHSLGLRHNMGASFATPVEKLRDKAWVEKHGHTASIMDYARFNYVAQPEDNISRAGLFPRINDYDIWAIKWGYSYRPEFKDEYAERDALKNETTKVLQANPRLWFGGEGRNEDPRSQPEDLGNNSVKASDYGIKNLKRVIKNLPLWTKQDNDDYTHLGQMYRAAQAQFKRYLGHVINNIASRYINNMPSRVPFEDTPAERQREAVDYINRQEFEAPLWLYPEEIVNKLGIDVSKEIISLQDKVLNDALSATTLSKLYQSNTITGKGYPVDEYLNDMFNGVWKPLTAQNEQKNMFRRALQRSYWEHIENLLIPTDKDKANANTSSFNSDALLYVNAHVAKIESFITNELKKATPNSINALHYADLLNRISILKDKKSGKK